MYSCVIVAAGKSERFSGGNINKTNVLLKGKPIYLYSVRLFLDLGFEVILVTNEDVSIPNVKIAKGGLSRSESVKNGVSLATGEYVFIHDAARPLISEKLVNLMLNQIGSADGFYLAKRISDSLKKIEIGKIVNVNRDEYFTAETPQVFKKSLLVEAFIHNNGDYQDEVSMINKTFPDVNIVPIFHNEPNDKVTVYEDLSRVERLARGKMKVGHSFDLHKLVSGRKLILGGIEIPSDMGLLGHSDADVLLHAITESIIGALGLGDLGTNFPNNDPKYKNISSVILLEKVINEMKIRNYGISNIDIMLYLERPKLLDFREQILNNVIKLLGVTYDIVNLKVTTTEKIGPIGKGEAIAAEAYCLLEEVSK